MGGMLSKRFIDSVDELIGTYILKERKKKMMTTYGITLDKLEITRKILRYIVIYNRHFKQMKQSLPSFNMILVIWPSRIDLYTSYLAWTTVTVTRPSIAKLRIVCRLHMYVNRKLHSNKLFE